MNNFRKKSVIDWNNYRMEIRTKKYLFRVFCLEIEERSPNVISKRFEHREKFIDMLQILRMLHFKPLSVRYSQIPEHFVIHGCNKSC